MSYLPSKDILCSSWAKSKPKEVQLYRYVLAPASHGKVASHDKPWAMFGAGATAYSKFLIVGGNYQTTGSQG